MKNPYSMRKDGRMYKEIIIGRKENGKYKKKMLYSRKGESWRDFDKRVHKAMLEAEKYGYEENNITFGDCIDMWWKAQVQISESTMTTYKSNLKRLDHLRHFRVKDLKPMHFQQLYAELYTEHAVSLLNHLPSLVNSILFFAVSNGYADSNANKKVKIPKLKYNQRRALTTEEKEAVKQAFDVFTPFQKAFVGLLYYTGMRRGEILALKTTDVDLASNCINVSRTLTIDKGHTVVEKSGTKTPAGMRRIPIVPKLKDILTEYISNGGLTNEYLFLTKNGNFVDCGTVRYRWEQILEKINRFMPDGMVTNISPHYFRHNFATELAYANVPMKTAQYLLGHEHINITMDIYADVRFKVEDSIRLLERVLI